MDILIPDIYQKSIYTINYNKLKENGIKCLLFDLDNTIAPHSVIEPTNKVIELFDNLKEMGFKIIIFSNAPYNRITPFKEKLCVDSCALCCKPSKRKFLKVLKIFNYDLSEVAIIGDQLFTDILGGNRVGITTILVNPISRNDLIITKPFRYFEKRWMDNKMKDNVFKKGSYYE